ncbi:hypothetical protein RHSIM_Rhsim02G0151200 [Rhododendron simsii]|uniref:Uncharacterized protein n=1 Tax=Rhododendron simsii TaxID=118357 RepID=A0A834LVI5_RHOSS|nr:hypothetical protein RHSIM_Rhsim02G0151200 [Rhododendron simsii]
MISSLYFLPNRVRLQWTCSSVKLFDASHLCPHYPLTGRNLHLVSMVKLLFNHIWDVLKDVPNFQHESRLSSAIFWYMKNSTQSNPMEDVFRCILTLHSLLENPPGDFLHFLLEAFTYGVASNPFAYLFVSWYEGKLSRKLIKCVNTYLLTDGSNLGCHSMEIHDAVKQFAFHCWTATHDNGLKDALILYARLQLNLTRGATDGSELVEHLLDVIGKELDQNSICSTNLAWSDTTKDDKCGNLTSSQCGVVELVMQKLLAVLQF